MSLGQFVEHEIAFVAESAKHAQWMWSNGKILIHALTACHMHTPSRAGHSMIDLMRLRSGERMMCVSHSAGALCMP